jgi:hypothetical protein
VRESSGRSGSCSLRLLLGRIIWEIEWCGSCAIRPRGCGGRGPARDLGRLAERYGWYAGRWMPDVDRRRGHMLISLISPSHVAANAQGCRRASEGVRARTAGEFGSACVGGSGWFAGGLVDSRSTPPRTKRIRRGARTRNSRVRAVSPGHEGVSGSSGWHVRGWLTVPAAQQYLAGSARPGSQAARPILIASSLPWHCRRTGRWSGRSTAAPRRHGRSRTSRSWPTIHTCTAPISMSDTRSGSQTHTTRTSRARAMREQSWRSHAFGQRRSITSSPRKAGSSS